MSEKYESDECCWFRDFIRSLICSLATFVMIVCSIISSLTIYDWFRDPVKLSCPTPIVNICVKDASVKESDVKWAVETDEEWRKELPSTNPHRK